MSRLTLRLPETLHQQLTNLAQGEGISLNQYIVYALTRQVTTAYRVEKMSLEQIDEQQQNFDRLVDRLSKAERKESEIILSEREIAQPEPELTPDIVEMLQAKIAKKRINNE